MPLDSSHEIVDAYRVERQPFYPILSNHQTVAHLHSPLAKLMRAFRPAAYNQNENNTIIGAQSLAAMVRLNAPRFSKRSADK
jgi:hypothetical protein